MKAHMYNKDRHGWPLIKKQKQLKHPSLLLVFGLELEWLIIFSLLFLLLLIGPVVIVARNDVLIQTSILWCNIIIEMISLYIGLGIRFTEASKNILLVDLNLNTGLIRTGSRFNCVSINLHSNLRFKLLLHSTSARQALCYKLSNQRM